MITEESKEGSKSVILGSQNFNCLIASYDNMELSCNLCNAKSVNLACESVEKLSAEVLTIFRET
jgi:hypothetical protein